MRYSTDSQVLTLLLKDSNDVSNIVVYSESTWSDIYQNISDDTVIFKESFDYNYFFPL